MAEPDLVEEIARVNKAIADYHTQIAVLNSRVTEQAEKIRGFMSELRDLGFSTLAEAQLFIEESQKELEEELAEIERSTAK